VFVDISGTPGAIGLAELTKLARDAEPLNVRARLCSPAVACRIGSVMERAICLAMRSACSCSPELATAR
jgi:hypothetical protein